MCPETDSLVSSVLCVLCVHCRCRPPELLSRAGCGQAGVCGMGGRHEGGAGAASVVTSPRRALSPNEKRIVRTHIIQRAMGIVDFQSKRRDPVAIENYSLMGLKSLFIADLFTIFGTLYSISEHNELEAAHCNRIQDLVWSCFIWQKQLKYFPAQVSRCN